jgi:hypothetical protein
VTAAEPPIDLHSKIKMQPQNKVMNFYLTNYSKTLQAIKGLWKISVKNVIYWF